MNKLDMLPRGFGAFPVLEVLDLTYNNLSEKNLPGNFFMMGWLRLISFITPLVDQLHVNIFSYKLHITLFFLPIETLRALYLADNDFEYLPPEIGQLKNLQIVRAFFNSTTDNILAFDKSFD